MSFSSSDSLHSYRINSLLPFRPEMLKEGVFLVLLHANRIPPHLVVLVSGKVFTLTVRGGTVDSDHAPLLRLIHKQEIETVFVRLNVPALFTMEQLREQIRKLILAYPRVEAGIATCLDPIKEFCGKVYAPEARGVNFVYELLPKLESFGVITDSYHLHMEPYLKQGSFELKKYSMQDIYEGIRTARLTL